MKVWEEENYRRERGREEKRKQPLSDIEINGLIKQAQIFGAHSESVGFGHGINETSMGRERKEIKESPTFSLSISFWIRDDISKPFFCILANPCIF